MSVSSLHWATAASVRLRATNAYLVDAALAVAVAVPLSVPFLTDPPSLVTVAGGFLNAGTVVPLVWRRRWPFGVAVVVFVFASLVSLYGRPGQMLQYGGLVAVYTVADLGRPWRRRFILGTILVTFPPAMLLVKHNSAPEFMFTLLLPLTGYLLGSLARTERARREALADRAVELERGREADAARAAAEERNRIARDMHDVLAHAVSVMVVQAEAGPVVVATDPERAARTFDIIAEAGRAAMAQLSDTLGVLKVERGPRERPPRVPSPTVAAIPSLVDQARRAGLRVELRVEGRTRPLAVNAEVAAYRIVQEALTNALRHARAGSVEVRLGWGEHLDITVTDDGPGAGDDGPGTAGPGAGGPGAGGPGAGGPGAGGHGLDGIRWRAEECGGWAEAGPTPAGFRVAARLPATAPGAAERVRLPAAARPAL
ncbi:sensor histidine kinase, partial [Rugosimonospora acidiphila]|uniref:sensor histidine kinase n=1 Tax=Rugosimonospora acidiphila TaxID=556531 RepID=UPI0031F17B93